MSIRKQTRNPIEIEIISLLAQRDSRAISLLYDNYSAALYGIIIRAIPSQEVATEVLQDVYLKVWNNADKYDAKKGKLFTWLVQITRNATIDTIRSGRYQRGTKTDDIETSKLGNELSTEMAQMDPGLQKVVSQLDEKYRILIEYIYFKGYTQSEVADELDIALGTVKTRVRTAIQELRTILQKEKLLLGILLFILIEGIRNLF